MNIFTISILFFGIQQSFEISKINSLIDQMGNDNYVIREKATNDVIVVGLKTLPYLRKAIENNACPEIQSRSQMAHDSIITPIIMNERQVANKYAVSLKLCSCGHCSGVIVKSDSKKTYILTVATCFECYYQTGSDDFIHGIGTDIVVYYEGKEYLATFVKKHKTKNMSIISINKGELPVPKIGNITNNSESFMWACPTYSFNLDLITGIYLDKKFRTIDDLVIIGNEGSGLFFFDKNYEVRLGGMIGSFKNDIEDQKIKLYTMKEIIDFIK